ncbi:VOC family protein [Camelimonas sp. ID_303_24]
MLNQIDRMVLATPDAAETARNWISLLGAEPDGADRIAALGARRTRLRLAQGYVELLEADGAGPVADALATRGRAHMFAAGFSTTDVAGLKRRLADQGVAVAEEHGQLHPDPATMGVRGLRVVVSPHAERPAVGLPDFFYEATLLDPEPEQAIARLATLFGIDRAIECPIASQTFGYEGALTLFQPRQLHRFEVINPSKPGTTMARQLQKLGPVMYMGFAESARIGEIEARARAAGAGMTVDRPAARPADRMADQLWLHPDALGGMMLGVSRPGMAWTWSGDPARVPAID